MSSIIDNIVSSHTHCNHCHEQPSVHTSKQEPAHPPKKKSTSDRLLLVAEKISAVALGAFSAYTNIQLFVPFFLVGIALGIHTFLKREASHVGHVPSIGCSQGFMEQLTGIKLPTALSLAANIAITICHIDHHETVFVPIVAISLGAWAGKMMMQCGSLVSRKVCQLC